MAHEVNSDGSIEENGSSFLDFDELTTFQSAIRGLGWGLYEKQRGSGGYQNFDLFFKQQRYDLHIYLKKVSFGGRDNRPFEKRVQFGANLERKGFTTNNSVNTIRVILGIYGQENNEEKIFCGWDIDEWGHNEGRAFNCFIDVSAISNAYKFGMAKHISGRGQVSYAFKKEFLIYYLFNQSELFESSREIIQFENPLNIPLQKILYGPPGTGKSTKIKELIAEYGFEVIRTTFHPDSDYQSFVGGYKPVMVRNIKEDKDDITYQFVPQAFTKAYVRAWQNPDKRVLLVIEELNRGNCAQIFGDLFQCLDRNEAGQSEYGIDAEADLGKYLERVGLSSKITLPSNLYLYATMNTSDQSLFPMDSAFKRRWDWEYVPIDYTKAAEMRIKIGENHYNWGAFLEKVNEKVIAATGSEDKQMGNFFVKPDKPEKMISMEAFKSKVMFYLWSEVFKHEGDTGNSIFQYKTEDGQTKKFSFAELFEAEKDVQLLIHLMNELQIKALDISQVEER